MLPFAGFFSSKLAPPKEEPLTSKEEKATRGEGHAVTLKERKATSLPYANFVRNTLNFRTERVT